MNILKKIGIGSFMLLLIPLVYFAIAFLTTAITVDKMQAYKNENRRMYLSTNGIHLDIILEKQHLDKTFLSGITHSKSDKYLAFGWGDEDFYLNTPTWNDLSFKTAFSALFLKSATLMHVSRYQQIQNNWVAIDISKAEWLLLNEYILNSFKIDASGGKLLLENKGYTSKDDFYSAHGSYSCFKTCNSWVNIGFKKSGLKACLWTPFDFGLMNKYQ